VTRLRWDVEGRDWPLREHSRFVEAGGLTWHVQQFGDGPAALLIHGTGASSHSWRDVAPLLAERFTVVVPDLPGHAFTRGRPAGGLTLGNMAGALAALLAKLGARPSVIAAHSAGAAIACRMAMDGKLAAPILGFGPALLPMGGSAAPIFSGLAKLLFLNPLAPRLFAGIARQPGRIDSFLLRATGSRIDRRGIDLYGRLFASSEHCAGAIEMMARWDLEALARGLPHLPVPLTVAHGERDSAIKAADAREAARLACARFELLPALGHLAHEERPALAAEMIAKAAEGGV
jgi:magnesium chelatase accessory protein